MLFYAAALQTLNYDWDTLTERLGKLMFVTMNPTRANSSPR